MKCAIGYGLAGVLAAGFWCWVGIAAAAGLLRRAIVAPGSPWIDDDPDEPPDEVIFGCDAELTGRCDIGQTYTHQCEHDQHDGTTHQCTCGRRWADAYA